MMFGLLTSKYLSRLGVYSSCLFRETMADVKARIYLRDSQTILSEGSPTPRSDTGIFFMITEESMKSLLEDLKQGAVPYVWAVQALEDYEDVVEDDGDDFEPQHYKVAIELVGEIWCMMGPRFGNFERLKSDQPGGIKRKVGYNRVLYDDVGMGEVRKRFLE